ncbi:MAG: hypothetical protein PHQ40_16370 [Anaerolineaceae bacterium]|nr:hypothetical protein [Anaerolineaceae bacterium]
MQKTRSNSKDFWGDNPLSPNMSMTPGAKHDRMLKWLLNVSDRMNEGEEFSPLAMYNLLATLDDIPEVVVLAKVEGVEIPRPDVTLVQYGWDLGL